jgi:RNA polymerase sigma-70 factor (ECF subfamily)
MSPRRDLPNATDQQLVTWTLEGHEAAFGEIVRRYQESLCTAISHFVGDCHTAEELAQDTFVKAHDALKTHRPESSFSAWLFTIANNVAVNYVKRQGRRKRRGLETVPLRDTSDPSALAPRSNPLAIRTPSTPPPRDGLAPALKAALEQLPEKQRECYVMHELNERSYEYISHFLNLPVGTVGWYIHRARKELRDQLGSLYDTLRARSRSTPS